MLDWCIFVPILVPELFGDCRSLLEVISNLLDCSYNSRSLCPTEG